jgi:hypothetical protein
VRTVAGRHWAGSAFVVGWDLVHRVKLVVDHSVDGFCGTRWRALGAWLRRELGTVGRSACLAHALPRRLSRERTSGEVPGAGGNRAAVAGEGRARRVGASRRATTRRAKRPEGHRLMWRRIRSMTWGWSGPMAAMIFIGWPQLRQMPGSSCQILLMSLAQERLRLRRNSGST